MRNCLVLGSGRSGTSMVAGSLAGSGYSTGSRQWKATDANPKGFHEDREVNSINEALLAAGSPWVPRGRLGRAWPGRFGDLQRWLALFSESVEFGSNSSLDRRIQRSLSTEPFALKDPRFCLTLPAWRSHLPRETAFVVVFREPSRTVSSILREVADARYLRGVRVDTIHAEALWCQSYNRVLQHREQGGDWIFVHYDQVVDGSALERIGTLLDADVGSSFVDSRLQRSSATLPVGTAATNIYRRLCQEASYQLVC